MFKKGSLPPFFSLLNLLYLLQGAFKFLSPGTLMIIIIYADRSY